MVFAESMRLYPPAWGIGRAALEAFEIGGIEVPAKSICLMSPYVMHRNSALLPRSRALRSRTVDARSAAGAPQVRLFPVRRRRAGVYRRTLRLARRRA